MPTLKPIPPLPSSWPFEPRPRADEPVVSRDLVLPGLGGGWTLFGSPSISLDGGDQDLGPAFGRGGVRRVGDVVLRPYRRGGMVRHVNARTYLSPARFAQEFLVHRALWLAGFPTVEPLGYGWKRRGLGMEGVFITRFLPSHPWPVRWDGEPGVRSGLRQAIGALCAWGLFAPDLNATNVLVDAAGRICLLDWDRARWGGSDLLLRYRARLLRSVVKLNAPRSIQEEIASWRPEDFGA